MTVNRNSVQEIRIVDLFEAIMERPYLYTLRGSYPEAVSFLEGYQDGLMKHHLEKESEDRFYQEDIRRYQDFKEWLSKRFGVTYKEALRAVEAQYEDVFQATLTLYREFKTLF